MKYDILKELSALHSVSWNEYLIENYIWEFACKNKIPYEISPWYGTLIWNPNAKLYLVAHIDEVWWIITWKQWEFLKFNGIWRVHPDMFVGRIVEIKTKSWEIVEWIVVGNVPLKVDYVRFWDLRIVLDKADFAKVQKWDFLRFKYYYDEKKNSIFASALDNRLSVFTLIEYISKHKKNKKLFEKIAFCFATEEEIHNKWAKYYMENFKPKDILILDVCPESFIEKWKCNNWTFILKKTPDFELDSYFTKILKKYDNFTYTSSSSPLLKNSEPYQYQKITGWKAINIVCPVYSYHSWVYFVEKEALENYADFVEKFILEFM